MNTRLEIREAGIRESRERMLRDFRVYELVKEARDTMKGLHVLTTDDEKTRARIMERLESALWMMGDPDANPKGEDA